MIAYFEHYRGEFAAPKYVIITLPLSKLVPRRKIHDRATHAIALAENPILYLFDRRNVLKSLEWLLSGKREAGHVPAWRVTRDRSVGNLLEPECLKGPDTSKRSETFLKSEFVGLRTAKRHGMTVLREHVEPLLSAIRAGGATPIIFVPPINPLVREFIETEMPVESRELVARMKLSATVYQVPDEFSAKADWLDAVHVCHSAALQLLPMLAQAVMHQPE